MIVDPKTFESWDFKIGIQNPLTEGVLLPQKEPSKNQTENLFELLEINEQDIYLDGPRSLYPQGHYVLLKISAQKPGTDKKILQFSSTARITKLDAHAANRARFELTLLQFDRKSWRTFYNLIKDHQTEIFKFIQDVRGV